MTMSRFACFVGASLLPVRRLVLCVALSASASASASASSARASSVEAEVEAEVEVEVDALLRGVDDVPPSTLTASFSRAVVASLLAIAGDDGEGLVRRARALRLAAAAPDFGAANDVDVDGTVARLLVSPERELRVQAAWARVARAARAGGATDAAGALLSSADPALREVGAIALWREGSSTAKRVAQAHLAVERDPDVAVVLRVRLARWPAAKPTTTSAPTAAPGTVTGTVTGTTTATTTTPATPGRTRR
jgi:hypothetical protein